MSINDYVVPIVNPSPTPGSDIADIMSITAYSVEQALAAAQIRLDETPGRQNWILGTVSQVSSITRPEDLVEPEQQTPLFEVEELS